MRALTLTLLGRPDLRDGGAPVALPTKKTLALLAYLALDPQLHARTKLAAMLWPDSDDTRGRGALRYTLTQLRTALGDDVSLVAQRDAVGFEGRPSALTVDVHALESADSVTDALALTEGDFMDSFSLPDSAAFEGWMLERRSHFAGRAAHLLERLGERCEARGDLDAALALAERWRARCRLDEAAHRRLIRVLLARGDRSAALRAFEECRTLFTSELDAELSPETEALAKTVHDHAARAPKPAAPARLLETPLVGRAPDLAALVSKYHSARDGQLEVVVLAGEAGIGKTRLSSEFLTWAAAQGADVLQGRAFETGGRLPYQPLVEALRTRIEHENAPDDLLEDVWLTEIARLLVELRERYPDLPAPGPEDGTSRSRLLEAIARLVAAFSERAPVVLLVDDVQWADVASLDVLHYAAKRWTESRARVLVLLAVRSEALAAPSVLPPWLLGLDRNVPVSRIELGALSADDTQKLVRQMSEGSEANEFARWLHAETGGQPFFIAETLRALVEAGHLHTRHEATRAVLELSAGIEKDADVARIVPPGIKQVVRARFERLSVPTKTFLLAAAVLGQSFSFDDARRVADLSENDALTAIDDLVQGLLLREAAERGAAAYLFAHDKIRDVVYREATDARRRVFHRRAVEVLELRTAAPAEIVRHALAAGLDETALSASIRAGDAAAKLLAPGDAILHFTRAIDLATAQGKADVALDALIRRAKARTSIAQWIDARNDLESALQKLAPAARELRAELLVSLSEACFWSLDVPRVHASGAEAITIAHEVEREDLERAALGWVGGANGADGKLDAALASYQRAVDSAARIGVAPPAHVLTLHSLTLYWVGRIDEAFARSRAAVDIAKTTNDVSVTLYALSQLGLALGAAGRYPEAWDVFEEARRYGREFGMDTLMARAIAMSGGTRLETYDFARAEEIAREACEISRAAAWPPAAASASIDLLFNFVRRGEAGKAEELVPGIAETVEKAAGFHGWLWRLRLRQVRAEIALARRDWENAIARADEVIARSKESNRPKYRLLGLATRGRALTELGKRTDAEANLKEALALARTIADPSLFLRVAATLLPTFGDDALAAEARDTVERVSRVLPGGVSRDAFERGVRDHLGLRV